MPESAISFVVPEPASHLEPSPLSFLPPPPTIPSFPVSGQAVPSLRLHHFDLVEASFTIPQPTIPSCLVPGLILPVHEPPVPSYPVPEPTGYLEQTNDYVNSLRLSPAPQHSPQEWPPIQIDTPYPGADSARYTYRVSPCIHRAAVLPKHNHRLALVSIHPPPQYGSSEGVVPNSPPRNSSLQTRSRGLSLYWRPVDQVEN